MEDKMVENKKMVNFSIEDFINEEGIKLEEYKIYSLNNDCIIFNKLYNATERKEKGSIKLQVNKDLVLSDCLEKFNEYQKWLNTDNVKNELIKKFCNFVNNYSPQKITEEEIIRNKWYENLEINGVLITIPN